MDTEARSELLAGLRDQTQEQIARALHAMFEELDSRLFELAERSRVMAQQQTYFNGLRECRRHRVAIETDFLQSIDIAFRIEAAPKQTEAAPAALSLMPRDELEETLALSAQADRYSKSLAAPLSVLEKRMASLLERDATPPADNPLSPESLGRAFRHAMQLLDVDVEIRLIAHSIFGVHVLGVLESVYSALNHRLAAAGVLPELRFEEMPRETRSPLPPPKHGPPRRVPDAPVPRTTSELRAVPATKLELQPDGLAQRLQDLRALIQHLAESGRRTSPSSDDSSRAAVGAMLDQTLLQRSLDQIWTYEGEPRELKSALLDASRQLDPDASDAVLQPEDEDVIDLIGLLFDAVRHDSNLPEPLRAVLARLQIPFLKTAIEDRSLLEADRHPARQLLDELGALALSWCPSADPDRSLLRQIAVIVESLASHHTSGPVRFDQAMEKLSSFLDSSRRRAEIAEQRSIETALGKERLRVARLRVAALLDLKLRDTDPLPWVRQILRGPWANYLVLLWLRQGETSAEYRQARHFIDELLWCDNPKARQEDNARLQAACAELPGVFRNGLARIASHDREIDQLAAQLDEYLSTTASAQPLPDFVYENDPTLALADLSRQLVEPSAESGASSPGQNQPEPSEIDPELLAHLRSLPPGSWFEFKRNGEPERAKLSWISPYSNRGLLVNRSGMKVQDMDIEQLAREIESGFARILDSARLLERTLTQLIARLQQAQSQIGAA
mgnify:CR=1 FL=1